MSRSESYVKRTEELLEEISNRLKFEIVDVEFVKEAGEYYLRVYCDMDKENGISIDDCVNISRALSESLDREDFIEESYILEVSSPGLGRTLKKDKDFKRELGKEVDLKLFKVKDGTKEFKGILKDFSKDTVSIEILDKIEVFNRNEIANIKLSINF